MGLKFFIRILLSIYFVFLFLISKDVVSIFLKNNSISLYAEFKYYKLLYDQCI
ncbi:hypothetical protein FM107_13095 [Sphingobacterium sp. JB170]|nr:hypothetical protein FM107_13095 [Sphingobacterium sp. JB170]